VRTVLAEGGRVACAADPALATFQVVRGEQSTRKQGAN
jgi:hypothetical protein